MTVSLRVTEIFHSLQGEARTVGRPTVFVRLTGCPLRCRYCDTAYAFTGGMVLSLEEILAQVKVFRPAFVTVTGGEPLAQPACHDLLNALCDQGYEVSLETGGAMDVAAVDPRVITVMDMKTPGSGEVEKNREANVHHLRPHDQVKFVICDRRDYDWAKAKIAEFQLQDKVADVLLSPSHGELEPALLAEWILADRLPVRFQIQLHKVLWGDERGK